MLRSLKERGDKAVIHAGRGRPSNRKIAEQTRERAIEILSRNVYQGFGPTLAAEYLAKKHAVKVGRETLRGWMREANLWRAKTKQVAKVHTWRARRSRCGELVQVGYQRARLAGGPRREVISDQHDRRCDQSDASALCVSEDSRQHIACGKLALRLAMHFAHLP